jgi:hypothetical protein
VSQTATKHRPAQARTAAKVARAKEATRLARARSLTLKKRAPVVAHDPEFVRVEITSRLVSEVVKIVDADPELPGWIEARIRERYRRQGRPREVSIRSALIVMIIHALTQRNLHFVHMPETLWSMHWRDLDDLGLVYKRNGRAKLVSYTQLLDTFHAIADAFDAWDEALVDDEYEDHVRLERAWNLQELVNRLCAASTAGAPRWKGNVALDATLKWSWERPPGSGGKVHRKGKDGDAGPPVRLSELYGDEDGDIDYDEFEDADPTETVKRSITMRTKRKTSWPSTWSLGSGWAGRKNIRKAVHGIALHSVVRADDDELALCEGFVVTPASANPAASMMPLLHDLHQRRAEMIDDPLERPLGQVIADPGYSMASPEDWHIPLHELGARPVFRPHKTNQDADHWVMVGKGARRTQVLFRAGRPMCECAARMPEVKLTFPTFPFTTTELTDYQKQIERLRQFEWKPNGDFRPNGSRQFLAPHAAENGGAGGCEHCLTADGKPVLVKGRKVTRCCQTSSRLFSAEAVAWWQDHTFGTAAWCDDWNVRSRVEGSYGILKNPAIVNWGRDFHHFVGLARETLAAAVAVISYNFHMLRSWQRKQRLVDAGTEGFDPFGPHQPTTTVPEELSLRLLGEKIVDADEVPGEQDPKAFRSFGSAKAGPPS